MSYRNDGIAFLRKKCEVYGRLDDTVYKHKRNGELMQYEYEYKPKYAATVLSKRTEIINRVLGTLVNLRDDDYGDLSKRAFYYTPYIVYAGKYSFTANTFFMIREKGEYEVISGCMAAIRNLAPRSIIKYRFMEEGSQILHCIRDDELYSQREIIVISGTENIEAAYMAWFDDNLAESLVKPVPDFENITKYHRHLESKDRYKNLCGKADDNLIILKSANPDIMHSRSNPSHLGNVQTRYFCDVYPHITECWKNVQPEFQTVWKKYHQQWFDENNKVKITTTTGLNLWTKILFRAASNLGYDLHTLRPDNWLPGIENIGDFLAAGDASCLGLSNEELTVDIFGREFG
jgi:hypothetical protein